MRHLNLEDIDFSIPLWHYVLRSIQKPTRKCASPIEKQLNLGLHYQ